MERNRQRKREKLTDRQTDSIFTVHKRSCRKVTFLHLSVSHSVHGGRCTPSLGRQPLRDRHPLPVQTPPRTDTPSGQIHPLGRHPWPNTPPDGHCSGRYASYWNKFLLPERRIYKGTETAAAVGDTVGDRSLLLEVKPDD